MTGPLRIAFGVAAFSEGVGGLQRAATALANAMAARRHRAYVFCPTASNLPSEYGLSSSVTVEVFGDMGRQSTVNQIRQRLLSLNIDVFLSMESCGVHLFWAACVMRTNIPFIYAERVDPYSIENIYWNRSGRLAALHCSDAMVTQFMQYAENYPAELRDKIRGIPNAAPQNIPPANPAGEGEKTYRILFLSRMHRQKRPDLLVQAFSFLAKEFPDWVLDIWGSGPLDGLIAKMAKAPELRGRLQLHGSTDNAFPLYQNAHIYCLPSEHEGFPNGALEAMVAGLPIVGFHSCRGLRYLVQDGVNGTLAKEVDPHSLASALATLMRSAEMRRRIGETNREAAKQYAPNTVFDKWEQLFTEMSGCKGNTRMRLFEEEPLRSRSALAYLVRQEHILRPRLEETPGTAAYWKRKLFALAKACFGKGRLRTLQR